MSGRNQPRHSSRTARCLSPEVVAKLEELEDLWGSEGLARRIGAGETTIVRAIGGLPLRPETCARIEEWVAKLP